MSGIKSAIERNKKPIGALEIPADFERKYLDTKDRQMRFNNGKDPIYYIFATLDRRPLSEILLGNITGTFKDTMKFISKVL